MPEDLTVVALQVLGIFFGSKASKKIYDIKMQKGIEIAKSREETVIEMIQTKGKVTRKEVQETLKISDSTAGRILDGMEKNGQIQQVGQHKGTYYIFVDQKTS